MTDSGCTVIESYITHIRITEDALSQSSPPPPDSPEEHKKERVIIVSVKRTGRVRLHKARENANGTFSIGKTWILDDLTAIESFSGGIPISYEEQQRKEWAGDTGLIVNIGKAYFWKTNTGKEKDFFISSLVKIHRKYTHGKKDLQLLGFSSQELAQFSATPLQQSRPNQTPSNSTSPAPTHPPSLTSPAPPYSAATPPGRSRRPSQEPNGNGNRDLRPPSSGSTSLREAEFQGQPPVPSLTSPESSQSLRAQDPRAPDTRPRAPKLRTGSNSSSRPDGFRSTTPRGDQFSRPQGPNSSLESLPNARYDTRSPPTMNADRPRANGNYSPFPRKEGVASPPTQPLAPGPKSPDRRPGSSNQQQPRPPSPTRETLPERKRPPLISTNQKQDVSGEISTVAPTASKDTTLANLQSNSASDLTNNAPPKEQPKQSAASFFMAASKRMKDMESNRPVASDSISETPTEMKGISQALSTLSSPSEPPDSLEETYRPGLGPMIKKKKSSKEVATAFRKAAVAHNAFKPRSGGAGDRLRDEMAKTPNTPDGIHGVFVAPSKEALKSPVPPPSALAQEVTSPEPLDDNPQPLDTSTAPSVEVKRTSDVANVPPLSIPKEEEKRDKESPAPGKEEQPKKRPSDNSAKYAKALGIDPQLLEGRTIEIDSVLNDYGWNEGRVDNIFGTLLHTLTAFEGEKKKTFAELQSDIQRDLARIETGSWLPSVEHSDERIRAVEAQFDEAIAACDELDGRLTLYNVELGVSSY